MLHEEQTICNTPWLNSSWVDLPCCTPVKVILYVEDRKLVFGIVVSYKVERQLNCNIGKQVDT